MKKNINNFEGLVYAQAKIYQTYQTANNKKRIIHKKYD